MKKTRWLFVVTCAALLSGCGSSLRSHLREGVQNAVVGKKPPADWIKIKTADFIWLIHGGGVNLSKEFLTIPASVQQVTPGARAYYHQVTQGLGVLVKKGYLTRLASSGPSGAEWIYDITPQGARFVRTRYNDAFAFEYLSSAIRVGHSRSVKILRYTKPMNAGGVLISSVHYEVRPQLNALGKNPKIQAMLVSEAGPIKGEMTLRKWNNGWRGHTSPGIVFNMDNQTNGG